MKKVDLNGCFLGETLFDFSQKNAGVKCRLVLEEYQTEIILSKCSGIDPEECSMSYDLVDPASGWPELLEFTLDEVIKSRQTSLTDFLGYLCKDITGGRVEIIPLLDPPLLNRVCFNILSEIQEAMLEDPAAGSLEVDGLFLNPLSSEYQDAIAYEVTHALIMKGYEVNGTDDGLTISWR